MNQYILSGEQSRFIDAYCINEMGIPSVVLMERAALAVAGLVREKFKNRESRFPKVLVVCHSGNNGADGLAAARILEGWGYPVTVVIIGKPEKGTKEFRTQLSILQHTHIKVEYRYDGEFGYSGYDVIIDGIFGIGLSREVQGTYAEVIHKINQSEAKIVAIDIPSGLNSDTGQPMGTAVMADYTVTFGNLKLGHKVGKGRDYCGKIIVEDIGFRKEAYSQLQSRESIRYVQTGNPSAKLYMGDCRERFGLPDRKQASNKGTYGKTAVIAGLGGMPGAAYFSAKAAYRCGTGLVKVITTKTNTDILKSMLPEAVYVDIDSMKDLEKDIREQIKDCRVLVIGPGLGTGETAFETVKIAMEMEMALVMDADALNILALHRELLDRLNNNIIITPHVMEMSRLLETDREEIVKDIVNTAEQFAEKYGCVCILKDASTVVSAVNGTGIRTYINITGNSGMATGGSGDVLSGILGALLAQKMEVCNAAEYGVYLHGVAGDLAAEKKTEYSVMASDILEYIPEAICQVNGQSESKI